MNSEENIFFTEYAPMQILETDKCKWHISCSPPLSMPQNKNNELLVFCPGIMTHKRQYHIMSMSYGNRSVQNSATFPTLLLKSSKKVVFLSEISSK